MMKHSKQRDAIFSFLMTRKDHPTAETIYTCLKEENPNLSLGTVYRNLTLLTDIGQIRRLRLSDGADHFDADTSPHDHFLCMRCNAVMDVHMNKPVRKTPYKIQDFSGEVEGSFTYYYGTCEHCLKEMCS
ncbi:MAG: transcriptional repressor [Lachnospiraceae bacterium]|nr:transcriptional repressor [Lachnospiraceae bacterium]